MATFTDAENRDWVLSIDVNALRRVRKRCDVKLMDTLGGETLGRLAEDPVLLVDVLYVLVEPEARERDVSPEAFGRALVGDALDAAVEALLEALADFCPSRRGNLLRQCIERGKRQEDRILARAEAMMASGEIDRLMAESLNPSGDSSTNSPDSPASTPDR